MEGNFIAFKALHGEITEHNTIPMHRTEELSVFIHRYKLEHQFYAFLPRAKYRLSLPASAFHEIGSVLGVQKVITIIILHHRHQLLSSHDESSSHKPPL